MTEKEIRIQIKGGVNSAKRFVGPFEKRGLMEGLAIVEANNFDLAKSLKALRSEIKGWKEAEGHMNVADHIPPIVRGLKEVKSLVESILYTDPL